MSKILALLSGKGGSGKTTLALSMSSMMSDFGIKVLLVDCDLCTNGATFFYENKISEGQQEMISFYGILSGKLNGTPVKINECMDFVPSVVRITKENTSTYLYKQEDDEYIQQFKSQFADDYDVIIFDCQAGYTDTLRLILPRTDINLAVMEPDAISSATIRGLYLKIGDFLNERNIYQVFNKVTDREYKIYSKISGGTVFTNIETIIFDWKIRRAFSVSQIPDMENTSADYGAQVYNVCKVLFADDEMQSKLKKYETVIEINKKKEEQKKLEDKIDELMEKPKLRNEKTEKIVQLVIAIVMGFSTCMSIYSLSTIETLSEINTRFFAMLPIIVLILMGVLLIFLYISEYRRERDELYAQIDEYMYQVKEIKADLQGLKKKHDMDMGNNTESDLVPDES